MLLERSRPMGKYSYEQQTRGYNVVGAISQWGEGVPRSWDSGKPLSMTLALFKEKLGMSFRTLEVWGS